MANETLRDITEIPFFAYEPGLMAWITLAAIALAAILLIPRALKLMQRKRHAKAFDKCLKDLLRLETESALPVKDAIFQASIEARRLLSAVKGQDLSSLAPAELARAARDIPAGGSKIVMEKIVEMEEIKYAPAGGSDGKRALIAELIAGIRKYKEEEAKVESSRN